METEIELINAPIAENRRTFHVVGAGACAEFRGRVRGEESGNQILALEYEAYEEMAKLEIRRLLEDIAARHPCLAVTLIHRTGIIPVGEMAIYIGVAARHRGPAFALLAELMDRLKQDVPIWKRRAIPLPAQGHPQPSGIYKPAAIRTPLRFEEALARIAKHCAPVPGVRVSLPRAQDRVLREAVCAKEDFPAHDRSTRDGYAVRGDDASQAFDVVDTLHTADHRPLKLKIGEAVRVATGTVLPDSGLRVLMQENVSRSGDAIRITTSDGDSNVRRQGGELAAGAVLLPPGTKLDAGASALLASAGCTRPLVNPRLRIMHFTTGDEIISPEQTPRPGQVRDSNTILILGLLRQSGCRVRQAHLPEDLERAKTASRDRAGEIEGANVILVSGGASVGEKDFTRPLLEWLGFQTIFRQVDIRPGRPVVFGVNGNRIAFGLPGNPLSHFVCFHLFVAPALSRLAGAKTAPLCRGILADRLENKPDVRETFWPARLELHGGHCRLKPLSWQSSGDITTLPGANALIRVPPGSCALEKDSEVSFLPLNLSGLEHS